jgi:hypothetical protein
MKALIIAFASGQSTSRVPAKVFRLKQALNFKKIGPEALRLSPKFQKHPYWELGNSSVSIDIRLYTLALTCRSTVYVHLRKEDKELSQVAK